MRYIAAALLPFLTTTAAPAAQTGGGLDPRAVVHAAERAVSDDSADAVAGRWRAALARDSADRAAALGLAIVARQTYDFETAERLLAGMLARAGGAPPDAWTVQARLGLSRVALSRGELRVADSLLRLALAEARRLGDRGGEMDALIGLSTTRAALELGLKPARATLDSLGRLLRPADLVEQGEHACRSGLYRGIEGDPSATGLIRQGIAAAERAGERQLVGHCLEALALIYSMQGRADSVLPIMDRAGELLRATRSHASLARLESRRSDELQARGRLGEARIALSRVVAEATRSRNRARMANAYGGLGMLALRVGDLTTASELFERAAAVNDSIGQVEGAMIARQNRAEVLAASGDLPAAREALLGTLEDATAAEHFEDVVVARQRLARVAIRAGAWEEAALQLAEAEREARTRGLDEVRKDLAYDRGRLALARGDAGRAAAEFTAMLSRVGGENRLLAHAVRVRLAEARARSGEVDAAQREIAAAFEELEAWRDALDDEELRRYAFAATALGEYDPQPPVARVLAALVAAGRVEAAFGLAERRRARTLTDRLSQAEALRETAAPAAELRRSRSLSAQEVVAALPDQRTALIEYVAGSEGAPTTMFVVTRAGVEGRVLPPADTLAPVIRRFVALLEAGQSADAIARDLGRELLGPAAELLPPEVTRVALVPDGPLHRVPFDALRLPGGEAAVERWALGLAPSGAVAATLWNRTAEATPDATRLLALADPAFPDERIDLAARGVELFRSAFDQAGGLPRLTGTGIEARAVARFAPGGAEVRVRSDASEAWLKQARLDRFRVIHLATHALVDETSLARTALALAPGPGEDGFLTPGDLARLRLQADLVVLSACRTAGGVTVAGEGVQGLAVPLLAAGARAVVATQWRIGDRSTVRLVREVYQGLAEGLPVAEALRAAKLSALRRGAPPSEWAGFTVVGDPLARVPLAMPAGPVTAGRAAAAAVLLLAVAGVYLAMRRRGRSADRGPGRGVNATTHQR